ncbi:MAG: DNA topoisomerase IV subunit A, partial [Betaproteobacteria bacterium]
MNEDQRDLFDEAPPAPPAAAAVTPPVVPAGEALGAAAVQAAGVAVVERPSGEGLAPPAAGGGGGMPPHFAPLSGEFGDTLPLGRYASTQYLQYAIATVKDRALPRVADGQKPVQGRILYAMWDNGTRAGTKRTKS